MRRALASRRFPLFLTVVLAIVLLAVARAGRGSSRTSMSLVLAAIALGHLARGAARRAARRAGRSPFDAALRPRVRRAKRMPELERIEREVALGLATAFDLHYRLRPRLRRIAAELLAARRGIDLDASPDAARRVLGDDAWELVRGDREPPRDRFAAGLDIASLRLAVTALEEL